MNIPSLSMLLDIVPREMIQTVLQETQKEEKRQRKLVAEWVLWICIVMAWLPRYSIQAVMANYKFDGAKPNSKNGDCQCH